MAEAFTGEIRLLAFGFAPEGWLMCEGQQISINQYQALYSLIGLTYGGNQAQGYFNLPDLRGRLPTHPGQGPLSTYQLGAKGGTDPRTISASASFKLTKAEQLPAHTHSATFTGTGSGQVAQPTISVKASKDPATSPAPIKGGYLGAMKITGIGTPPNIYVATADAGLATLNTSSATATGGSGGGITGGTVSVGSTGAGEAVPLTVPVQVPATMPPFLAVNYAICVSGLYPQRPW